MDFNSNFFKTISLVADILTLVTVLSAIPFALLKRKQNLFAFKISKFLHYLLRCCIMLVLTIIIFRLAEFVYFILLLSTKHQIDDSNYVWETGKEWQHLVSYFVSGSIALSLLWIMCSFVWTSSWNLAKEFFNLFLPKNKLFIRQESPLEILNATYKTTYNQIDITQLARQMISQNKLTIKASNELAGDPHPGAVKALIINYRIGQKTFESQVTEGETLSIP
jgi:hypothetical protein